MRTKALICAAVLGASLVSTFAQVYSLNVVGYVNKTVAANTWYLWTNPLKTTNDTTATVMAGLSGTLANWDNSLVYGWNSVACAPGSFTDAETFVGALGQWLPGTVDLSPGKGFFFFAATAGTVTFVGEVGTTNDICLPANAWTLVGSTFPISADLATLGFEGRDGGGDLQDLVYRYSGGYNAGDTFVNGLGWLGTGTPPGGPVLDVGEGIFYQNKQAAQSHWVKSFTIN